MQASHSSPGIIGAYRLLSSLGEGGMGVVWRAEHIQSGQVVALKTVKIPHEGLLRGIRVEIKALARLSHPGVVRILDEGIHEGLPWYAMELLDAVNLKQWHRGLQSQEKTVIEEIRLEETRLPGEKLPPAHPVASPTLLPFGAPSAVSALSKEGLAKLLGLFYRLCAPLAFLHGEGLLHRDLKPENILVRPDGTPVLVDFGIASPHSHGGTDCRELLAVEAGIVGTVHYMSPEQIQGETPDPRSDLYALGVIFYELLTGRRPFEGRTALAVLKEHLQKKTISPSKLVPSLPPALSDLVLRLLAKKREERPGYAEDVARLLRELGAQSGPQNDLPRPRAYLYRPRFAGREALKEQLLARLQRLEQGEGGLLLLGGESGAGKTRLVMEVARKHLRQKKRILIGECLDQVNRAALCAFQKPLQALSDHCLERGSGESERIFGRRGRVLGAYEPSILSLPGQSAHPEPDDLPPDPARRRLFSYLGESLYAFCQERPLLLILDDLQWADALSLGFLQFMRRGGALTNHLLVLGTYRKEEVSAGLLALLAEGETERLEVGRLGEDAVTRIVGDMLGFSGPEGGDAPPRAFCRFLSRQSEGNPFFVAEYIRTAVEEGFLWRGPEGKWQVEERAERGALEEDYTRLGLPTSLKTLVERWLGGLSEEASALLSTIALLGREVELPFLEEISPGALGSLGELYRRQIVEEVKAGTVRFTHDKLKEGALARIEAEQRAPLHRRVALAIEEISLAEERWAELGHHWEQAGEAKRAREYYWRAARRAARAYHYQEAERLFRAALALLPAPCKERLALLRELSEQVFLIQSRHQEALPLLQEALREAQGQGESQEEAGFALLLGESLRFLGRTEEALRSLQRALFLAQTLAETSLRGNVLRFLGDYYRGVDAYQEAADCYHQALSLAREIPSPKLEGVILRNTAILYQKQGQIQEAIPLYEKALAMFRALGARPEETRTLGALGSIYKTRGQWEDACFYHDQALRLARELGNRSLEARLLSERAGALFAQGQLPDALRLYQQALAVFEDLDEKDSQVAMRKEIAEIFQSQGLLERSLCVAKEALGIAREIKSRSAEGAILGVLASLRRWMSGDIGACQALAAQAEALLSGVAQVALGSLLCLQGHLSLASGQSAQAFLTRAQKILLRTQAGKESALGQEVDRLLRAQTAFARGKTELLFLGVLLQDIPAPLQKRLKDNPPGLALPPPQM